MSSPPASQPPQAGFRKGIAIEIEGEELVVLELPAAAPSLADLSPAVGAVVALALRGLSNREIAEARGISTRTVAAQLAAAYKKLGVGSRRHLAAIARTPRGR